ncbi:DUF402 domain-containing protein [Paenibacillus sp. GYB003]|uniref:DUF402 domain-containing protein n=1 Tax=Paenibacillus sp. GYB003 TaxID=2994392 RepID=UPI002F96586C
MSFHLTFRPGEPVVLRRVWNGTVYRVTTATVVRDDAERIALYWGPGYPIKSRRNLLSVTASVHTGMQDGMWGGTEVLLLASPEASHAVCAFWRSEDRRFLGWYINLQAPLRRMSVGFDTTDYLLDITANRERTEWSWKDEAEFEEAVAAGNFSSEQAAAIRAEGERAIRLLQAGPAAYYDSWIDWSPPPDWRPPVMPPNWDAAE